MKYREIFFQGIIAKNPVFVMVLGLCSALAVTTMVLQAVTLCIIVLWASVLSSGAVSTLRHRIPKRFRLMASMMIVSTTVVLAETVLRAFFPVIAHQLGPYVGLVITNCIVLGRIETYALHHAPLFAIFDAAGVSCGYGLVLIAMASIREILGFGSLLGISLLPDSYVPCTFVISPAGGFLIFACILFLVNTVRGEKTNHA